MFNLLSTSPVGLFLSDGQRVIGVFESPIKPIKCKLHYAILQFDHSPREAAPLGRFIAIHSNKD